MTSPDGKCHTFDASANGYCRGEGCGAVVLKRLSDATKDGDSIYAVIRGSAVLQDGKSASLTAPNGQAQETLLRATLADAKLQPNQVQYIEAHGTGTPLGDPIEIGAIAAVYGKDRDANSPLYVSSVKANIGHLEAAAGMSGLLAAIASLRAQKASPNAQLKSLNPKIKLVLNDAAIQFPTEVIDIGKSSELGECRKNNDRIIIGVNSFGYSGTIAHVLLEEAPYV